MRGEIVSVDQLLDASSLSIPPGHRAMTIRVDGVASVNGAISPGVRVDVLTSIVRPEKAVTRTLLQNIPVIAVSGGTSAPMAAAPGGAASGGSAGSGGGEAVTLLVTPRQAETLTLAGQVGVFHLTLRNLGDTQTNRSSGTDLNALMTGVGGYEGSGQASGVMPRPPNFGTDAGLPLPPMPGGKSGFSMRIYRGSGSETIEFQQ
jgi:pilus assembly protein CpaB